MGTDALIEKIGDKILAKIQKYGLTKHDEETGMTNRIIDKLQKVFDLDRVLLKFDNKTVQILEKINEIFARELLNEYNRVKVEVR